MTSYSDPSGQPAHIESPERLVIPVLEVVQEPQTQESFVSFFDPSGRGQQAPEQEDTAAADEGEPTTEADDSIVDGEPVAEAPAWQPVETEPVAEATEAVVEAVAEEAVVEAVAEEAVEEAPAWQPVAEVTEVVEAVEEETAPEEVAAEEVAAEEVVTENAAWQTAESEPIAESTESVMEDAVVDEPTEAPAWQPVGQEEAAALGETPEELAVEEWTEAVDAAAHRADYYVAPPVDETAEIPAWQPVSEATDSVVVDDNPAWQQVGEEEAAALGETPEELAVEEWTEAVDAAVQREERYGIEQFAEVQASENPDSFTPSPIPLTMEAALAAPPPDASQQIHVPEPELSEEERAEIARAEAERAAKAEKRALLLASLQGLEQTIEAEQANLVSLRADVEGALAMKTTLNNTLSDSQMAHAQMKHGFEQAQTIFQQAEEVYSQVERDLAEAARKHGAAAEKLAEVNVRVTQATTEREAAEEAVRKAHEAFLKTVDAYNQTVVEYEGASRDVQATDSFYRQVAQALEQIKPQRDMYYAQYGAALRGTETANARLQSAETDYGRAVQTYDYSRRELSEAEDRMRGLQTELMDLKHLLNEQDES